MSKVGRRLARATGPQDVKFGMSSKDNLQVAVAFQFTNPDDEYCGQTIVWTGTFAPGKASEIALEALENCGWAGDDVMDMTGIDTNEVELVIIEEPSQDGTKTYEKVSFVNRPGANRFTFQQPVEGTALVAQSRILGQNIRAIRASQGRRPAAQTRPRTPPAASTRNDADGPPLFGQGEDDLPF